MPRTTMAELRRRDPAAAAALAKQRRISRDVQDLNPDVLDGTTRREMAAQFDEADTLRAELRRLAPDIIAAERDRPFERYHIDLAWPAAWLAVEVDGGQRKAGGGKHGGVADYIKLRRLVLAGWRVLRFTAGEVTADPLGCIADIRAALAQEVGHGHPQS